ncbi:MAG: gliding motility-associated C-terminal domain-containing protein, partial [Bacteroidota bacterium]
PSAFSPNGDGKNDLFRLLVKGPVELNSFIVFNRWGQVVFETNDLNTGWNGQFNNTDQAVGTYVYSITAKNTDNETIILQGNVTLIR